MDRKLYKAFTLIEMLIVMGILIILMVIGVAAGRFAINRANEIAHQNGANQLYQALQSYFTDQGKFPVSANEGTGADATATLENMTSSGGILAKYLDMGAFKGGSEATYYYFVNTNHQSVLVCVTLGGYDDETDKGIACVGNGFSDESMSPSALATLNQDKLEADVAGSLYDTILNSTGSDWNGKGWGNDTTTTTP